MKEEPKAIILTEAPIIPIQTEEKANGNPGRASLVIGFVLIFTSIFMFSTLNEFCCLIGVLALVIGVVFLGIGFQETRNWRKDNDNKKWTIGELLVILLLSVFGIPLGLGILEFIWIEFYYTM